MSLKRWQYDVGLEMKCFRKDEKKLIRVDTKMNGVIYTAVLKENLYEPAIDLSLWWRFILRQDMEPRVQWNGLEQHIHMLEWSRLAAVIAVNYLSHTYRVFFAIYLEYSFQNSAFLVDHITSKENAKL